MCEGADGGVLALAGCGVLDRGDECAEERPLRCAAVPGMNDAAVAGAGVCVLRPAAPDQTAGVVKQACRPIHRS
jgi:hypothetical protein